MAATLRELDIAGTVRERPKLLGTYIQTTRAYTGPTEALPITTKEKLYNAKSTAMAKAAAGSWSRLPALAELSKFQSSINAIDNTDGHLEPLFRGHTADAVFMIGFRQSQYILTKHHLEHVPTTRPVQLAANLDEAPRMAGKGSPSLDPRSCCHHHHYGYSLC